MLTFTLAISCLTTSNLPWFRTWHSRFLCNIALYSIGPCFYHQSHPTNTQQTVYWFSFGYIPSFFMELFLHWSAGAYWAPTDLGSSSFSILSFCHFILFMGFSRQEYWSGLPFPSPVDHVLSDLSTMTYPSWLDTRAWLSFIELDKAVVLVWLDWLIQIPFLFLLKLIQNTIYSCAYGQWITNKYMDSCI